jgi:two-component system chemotaxis response regulator CheB
LESTVDKPVSVLIVDDSALMRKVLCNIFDPHPDIKIASRAMNGSFALRKLKNLDVDVITLDLEMPQMNGIDFLKERRKRGIDIPVIILSSLAKRGAKITMEALSLGASDFVLKPSTSPMNDISSLGEKLVELVRIYGRNYQRMKSRSPFTISKEELFISPVIEEEREKQIERIIPRREPGIIKLIAIGISTGGPNALRSVFQELEASISSPILVVQHMPPGFTEEFANSLNSICSIEVKEAADGDILRAGRALIAPGDRHIVIEKKPLANIVRLSDAPPHNGHKPSVGILFSSIARTYQNNCLAIIMTGMGKDGASEIGEIYLEGGITIAQSKESCVVFGMPKAAIESGFIHSIVPLGKMAETINYLSKKYAS